MAEVRPAAVAGAFYPGDPEVLDATVRRLLADAPPPERSWKAVLTPHAGYVYSGPTAAVALRQLQDPTVRRIVLLGPTHRVPVRGLALPSVDAFATPLGVVPLDRAAMARVADLPQVVVSDAAHALEHSLEVQLPFLQVLLGDFALVPFAVGDASPAEVAEVIDRFWDDPHTRVVISSDLSHYLPYEVARRRDLATLEKVRRLQGPIRHEEACGATPLNGLLVEGVRRGLRPVVLDYRNSGDTAGPRNQVVGYGAVAFAEA